MTINLHLARRLTPTDKPTHALRVVLVGSVGGCALGVTARVWMRMISEDPDFTWSGTTFIVAGFTIFGFAQAIVAVARERVTRRSRLRIVRAFGAVAMVPLFGAAGSVMLPTVLGFGLAVARTGWRRMTRGLCALAAAGPVLFVGSDLIDSFGWSLRSLAGFVGLLAIYTAIIWAAQFTFIAQPDGWRLSRRGRVYSLLLTAAVVSILLVVGGGFG